MNSLFALVPLAVGVMLLAFALPRARRSTVMFAWSWACAALIAASIVQWADGAAVAASSTWLPAARFAAMSLTFCPIMSVLGSKRPHEQAWQWIVLSLWGILVLPAAEWLVLRRGATWEIHGVRAWFLLVLIAMQIVHGLGTRAWLASLLLVAAQTAFFAADLPVVGPPLERLLHDQLGDPARRALAWSCGLLAIAATWHAWRPRADSPPRERVWREFRDRFGLLWSLRIEERIQAAAGGGRVAGEAELDQVQWNLLRRFVSRAWCVERGWTPPEGGGE